MSLTRTLSDPSSLNIERSLEFRILDRLERALGEREPEQRPEESPIPSTPADFRDDLILPSAQGPKRYGDIVQPFQSERYADLDQDLIAVARGDKPPRGGRHWWEATKGASKDTDLAINLMWLLAWSPRFLRCQVGAADRKQAKELRDSAKAVLSENPWLEDFLKIDNYQIKNPHTESEVEILPADIAGSHGAKPNVLVINELTHIRPQHKEFAENLMDNADKVDFGVVIIATNAGQIDTWQWQWRETARTSPRWAFHKLDRPSPWTSEDLLAESRRRNPKARYDRLWNGIWSTGSGEGIPPESIDAAIDHEHRPMTGKEPGYVFVAGLDIGIHRHRTGLCVVGIEIGHMEWEEIPENERRKLPDWPGVKQPETRRQVKRGGSGMVKLAYTRSWKPGPGGPVDTIAVENEVERVAKEFRCPVFYDTNQAERSAQGLRRKAIRMEPVNFTSSECRGMATATLEMFADRKVVLYADTTLITDLRKMEVVEKSYGFRIEQPEDDQGHGDLGTAYLLALYGSRNIRSGGPTLMDLAKRI